MQKIGFTGTQTGMTDKQIAELMLQLRGNHHPDKEFHHGDCVGADFEAHEVANAMSYCLIVHPPIDDKARAYCEGHIIKEPKPYLERNRDIVDETDILIAAPRQRKEVTRSGTWATIRYARSQGKEVIMLWPR